MALAEDVSGEKPPFGLCVVVGR